MHILQKSRSIRMIMHDKLASLSGSKIEEVNTEGNIIIQCIVSRLVSLPRKMNEDFEILIKL